MNTRNKNAGKPASGKTASKPIAAAVAATVNPAVEQQTVAAETAESRAAFRRNSIMRVEDAGNEMILRFVYNDPSLKPLEFDARKCPDLMVAAAMHGFRQKIADAAAIGRNADGKSASPAEKREAMQDVVDNLYANKWNADREAGTSLLVVAIADVFKKDVERVREWLNSKSAAERNALNARADVQQRLAQIRTERAQSAGLNETADKLLSELDGM